MLFSPRFDLALKVAAVGHAAAVRKGTALPYLSHPVHVARLLERAGLPEDVVLAGILHDVVEDLDEDDEASVNRFRQVFPALRDRAEAGDFREALREYLDESFGAEVLRLVDAVTERKDEHGRKRPWIDRKREVITHLEHVPLDVVALKAADVLHNVRSLLQDIAVTGMSYLDRFNAGPEDTLWYYRSVAVICGRRLDDRTRTLADELQAAVDELAAVLRT